MLARQVLALTTCQVLALYSSSYYHYCPQFSQGSQNLERSIQEDLQIPVPGVGKQRVDNDIKSFHILSININLVLRCFATTSAGKKNSATNRQRQMAPPQKHAVLVLLATGKLGGGIVDAFLDEENDYELFGASRNPQHPQLLAKNVSPVPFTFGDKESIQNALKIAQPQTVVVITHFMFSKDKQTEVEHGWVILDACQEANIEHVILTSTDLADITPEKAYHLSSKRDIEQYAKSLNLNNLSILRSGSFFENFDDSSVMNPLVRGYLRDLYEADTTVNHVSTYDVGKAAVAMARDPQKWKGKTLSCIVASKPNKELVPILSEVSGVSCVYQRGPPKFALKTLLPFLDEMVEFRKAQTGKEDWSKEIQEFKSVVPDAMDFKQWLVQRQKTWSDGTNFGDPAPPRNFSRGVMLAAGVAVMAFGARTYMQR